MKIRTKKLPNGFELPVLGIGTFGLGGGDDKADYSNDDECINIIQAAIKLGYSHIDTAEKYGLGHTEELVGKAIKISDRAKLLITTKVDKEHLKYDDVLNSAKNSLKRLDTDYIDLYLIHAPNPDIPLKETMAAMDFLVDKRLVRNIGVSNFKIAQVKEAQKYAKHPIVANQLKYNLFVKSIFLDTIKYCQDNDIMVIGHKPFGRGRITTDKIQLLSDLAKKYNKTEAQIVLNWLILKKNTVTIFKAMQIKHLKENLGALDFELEREDCEKIDNYLINLLKS